MKITRRQFVEASALGCATAVLPGLLFAETPKMPMREFGKTGVKVPILAFGGGSRYLMYQDADEAIAVLNHAIDLGVTYIDTAHEYGEHGESEMRIGEVMKTRRKEVFLATKFSGRTAEEGKRMIETSLQRLQTDHVDVLHIHGLGGADDLAAIEAPDGALKALYWARDQKMTRFAGITGHADPHTLAAALERHDFDCTQMALNAGLTRMEFGVKTTAIPMPQGNFETVALPVAKRKNLGVIAMKVFGQEWLQRQSAGREVDLLLHVAAGERRGNWNAETRVSGTQRRTGMQLCAFARRGDASDIRLDCRRAQDGDGRVFPQPYRRVKGGG